jgi:hypothetical protein
VHEGDLGELMPDTIDNWVWEEAPCELCPHAGRCRRGAACAAFESFVRYGGHRWRNELREPSRVLYRQIFWPKQ